MRARRWRPPTAPSLGGRLANADRSDAADNVERAAGDGQRPPEGAAAGEGERGASPPRERRGARPDDGPATRAGPSVRCSFLWRAVSFPSFTIRRSTGMDLADYIDARLVTLDLEPGPVSDVLEQVVEPLVELGEVREPGDLVDRLVRRENLQSTGIGSGLAVPHCLCDELEGPRVLVGVCPRGTEYHALDDRPVQLIFLLLSPDSAVRRHVRLLARIARLTRRPGLLERIRSADTPADVVHALRTEERERI